ncbi:MAG TPA: ECF-type sigma factor [Bryobacteraceae bacterium]|nr:ECF-type sigma factor [Bryobacteraceae bacterium]
MKNERPENTLQTTALVHEVYLRIVATAKWNGGRAIFRHGSTDDAAQTGGLSSGPEVLKARRREAK